jgi:hypothetical protein
VTTSAEIALLLRVVPGRRSFAVLDWRDPQRPSVHEVFPRAWAPSGFVARAIYPGGLPSPELLLEGLGGQGPILLTGESPLPDEDAAALAGLSGTLRIQEHDGELYRDGRALSDLEPPDVQGQSTRLIVRGRGAFERGHLDLPFRFTATPCEPAARSLIRVEGENRFSPMPPPRWFRVTGPGPVVVTIDVRPSAGGDAWRVTAVGGAVEPSGDPTQVGPPPRLRRLGLVFDCTCPDRGAWSEARGLIVSGASRVKVSSRYGGDEDTDVAPADLNREIRETVAKVMTDAFAAEPIPIHFSWFGDGQEKGVVGIEGIDSPEIYFGEVGVRPSDRVGDDLRQSTYIPGLDLWDPLEEALDLVATSLLREPATGSGIVIVGNSPPNLPLRATCPLWELLEFRGVRTTTRRKNTRFTDAVARIEAHGIPLVYLFLTHDRCGEQEQAAFKFFESLQAAVQKSLAAYLTVLSEPADAAGVTRGLREALRLLASPSPSGAVVAPLETGP